MGNTANPAKEETPSAYFWSLREQEVMAGLKTDITGLTSKEAEDRLKKSGSKNVGSNPILANVILLLKQFKSPVILILLFAGILSFFLSDSADGIIILCIVLASGLLGFWQELGATNAIKKLLAVIAIKVHVLRDGAPKDIPVKEIVPGDIVVFSAGDVIPGDCLLVTSKDLFVNESALTGESFPAEKQQGTLPPDASLVKRTNCLFMGTHVISGTATAVVVKTGNETEFGQLSVKLKLQPQETDFERGIRRFGNLLAQITLLLVFFIFAANVFFHKPVLEAFLFSLAIAIGLTPQLLPAIISVNLSYGARKMAEKNVIVKVLESIENFGSMNVLCSDKTGTLTEGVVQVHSTTDCAGKPNDKVMRYAYLNAALQTGFANPIDLALRQTASPPDISGYIKVDEVPYDFIRKRLSILVQNNGTGIIITKGALTNVLDACSMADLPGGTMAITTEVKNNLLQQFETLSQQGCRVLGIAIKDNNGKTSITKEDEKDMTFLGFLSFNDPPKAGITKTLADLKSLGIDLKIITGDNAAIAAYVSKQVGIDHGEILTGAQMMQMNDAALIQRANTVAVFAEVEPNQKERIILALKKSGNVVGYMGDGINDASALHAADVGISVDSAVDAAKEAAHIVLLEKTLDALISGVREGRRTFSNTLKYIFMATSANFGNMFSMAGASLFLPFIPLLPTQILLMNLLTDFPEMTIATDSVDEEMITKPRKWDIKFIRSFMFVFGPISSLFDYLTFGMLLYILHANTMQFRTGWFLESVISAALIVLVVRTRKPFIVSKPGKYLLITTVIIIISTALLPVSPLAPFFGFTPLPPLFYLAIAGVVILYVLIAELAKHFFYRGYNH
ncbi:MAG TPA: magnesium-translocating P-type ATPase [Chitinophagales bacterium]|nr:magnesium-translocating P-type ATPase [Chitinophagales bacterium]